MWIRYTIIKNVHVGIYNKFGDWYRCTFGKYIYYIFISMKYFMWNIFQT